MLLVYMSMEHVLHKIPEASEKNQSRVCSDTLATWKIKINSAHRSVFRGLVVISNG